MIPRKMVERDRKNWEKRLGKGAAEEKKREEIKEGYFRILNHAQKLREKVGERDG